MKPASCYGAYSKQDPWGYPKCHFGDRFIFWNAARRVVDTRNYVIHGYDSVTDDIMWGIVMRHLPMLKAEVEKLLDWLIFTRRFTIQSGLCWKILSGIVPQIAFFLNFALDLHSQRVGDGESHIFLQKVLLKFYLLKSNFATLKFHEDKVGNSTCIGCLYPAGNGRLYSNNRCGAIVLSVE